MKTRPDNMPAEKGLYKPVSCALHSELELLIIRQSPFELTWQPDEGSDAHAIQHAKVIAIDLCTRNHEEYLTVSGSDNDSYTIRLDHIISVKTN